MLLMYSLHVHYSSAQLFNLKLLACDTLAQFMNSLLIIIVGRREDHHEGTTKLSCKVHVPYSTLLTPTHLHSPLTSLELRHSGS